VQAEFEALSAEYESAEELPDDIDAKFGELESEIERLSDQQQAYDPEDVARSGVFAVLNHDGTVRLERGFVRPEDEKQAEPTTPDEGESGTEQPEGSAADAARSGEGDDRRPLSDLLVRDLTAHRTAGLRVTLGEHPEVALIAVTHALAARLHYHEQASCLTIRADQPSLTSHSDGIEDTPSAKTLSDRHANWARQLPEDVNDLWAFVVALDADSRMALLAHCVASTVNAVSVAWATAPCAGANADAIAHTIGLDMTAFWTPTARTYFGRVSKARILEAVTEAVSAEVANRLAEMKKQAMAEAAEQLLAGTRWLPPLLRTRPPSCAVDEARALEPQPIAAE
jgi:ParB family chromosome partitioning protein